MRYPHVVRYPNSFMRDKSDLKWTSIALHKKVPMEPHVDLNNSKQDKSVTVTFGEFQGGQMWIHDPSMESRAHAVWKQDGRGQELPGRLEDTFQRPYDSSVPILYMPHIRGVVRDGA